MSFFNIYPSQVHPNVIKLLTGYLVINHKFGLDLSLGDILFIYILKIIENESNYLLSLLKKTYSLIYHPLYYNKGWENNYIKAIGKWEFDSHVMFPINFGLISW